MRAGLLSPSLMGFAVRQGSPLLVPLDQSLVRATTSTDWTQREAAYFAR